MRGDYIFAAAERAWLEPPDEDDEPPLTEACVCCGNLTGRPEAGLASLFFEGDGPMCAPCHVGCVEEAIS